MIKYFFATLLLSVSTLLLGQSGQNPFDIEGRSTPDGVESATVLTTSDSESSVSNTNVFDVARSDAVTPSPKITQQAIDSTNVTEWAVESSTEVALSPDSDNPFEVSHIPVRKSKLKQKADAFVPKQTTQDTGTSSSTFIFWLILVSAFLLAIVINTKRSIIPNLTKALLNENMLKYNHREEGKGYSPQYILMYCAFIINASIFLYLLAGKYMSMNGFKIFGYCVATIVAIYAIKHIVLKILAKTFPMQKEANLYSFAIQSYNLFVGLVLIPLNLIIAFGPTEMATVFLYLTLAILFIILIMRCLRGLTLGAAFIQQHLFHFFLYLCAFELVPLMVIIKAIQ